MESFEELVEQYTPMIHHVIRTLNIYKNREDYFQTGVIALWEAKERFDPEKGKFSAVAYSYIRGRILEELKERRTNEEINVYPEEEFWDATIDENEAEPLELATLLTYCYGLSTKQKQWVIDTFYFGMSVKEIAEKEKVSLSAVKKWRSVAMQKIKENVESSNRRISRS